MEADEFSKHHRDAEYRAWHKGVETQYDGRLHWSAGVRFWRPKLDPAQLEDRMSEIQQTRQGHAFQKRHYLNPSLEECHGKYSDLDTYYSSTRRYPRRLVVQATKAAHNDPRPRHWGQKRLKGNIPFVIKLAELCLNPFGLEEYDASIADDDDEKREKVQKKNSARRFFMAFFVRPLHWITSITLTLLLSWIIQLGVSAKIITRPWTDSSSVQPYKDYENVHWHWPKHAVNVLDQSPSNTKRQANITNLTVPRFLVVWDAKGGQWEAKETSELRDKNTGMLQPYIFFSFSRSNYPADDKKLRLFFHSIAQSVLDRENASRDPKERPIEAFWVDTDCVSHASPSEEFNDVNTICDAVRCAKRVYILLPSDSPEDKRTWGKRIWTLPEVLLAAEKIRYCITPSWGLDKITPSVFRDVSLTDMYHSFWPEVPQVPQVSAGESHGERHEDAISHLIDHYTNRTKLTELQLFTFAVQALAHLTTGPDIEGYTTTSLAYAAMGLLSYRITPDDTDNAFQAIARLSLVNDTNRLLERLICLWPYAAARPVKTQGKRKEAFANNIELLRNIADRDQYATHLWDIKPICDVVGIGDEETPTVILDRCRGIPIRWKSFPRLKYVKEMRGFRATISELIMHFGSWFLLAGINLFTTVAVLGFATIQTSPKQDTKSTFDSMNVKSSLWGVAVFLAVGWIISWSSPSAIRQLCNGGVKDVSCHLVGFEGTLPLREIEKIIYSNYRNRLSYAASTTPFSERLRDPRIRTGVEPKDPRFWDEEFVRLGIPKTHRLFTIVDTGSLTVSVIAAERPPVVALICGREGGMLRTLLCSWRFENNCLYRECVMRMRSSLEGMSMPNDWLKVSLASQGDVSRMRMA